jgi:hypothetical protein
LRAVGTAKVNRRVTRLQHLEHVVTNARLLTSPDRAQLSTSLAGQLTGMQGLLAKIPTDATCADVLADGQSMVNDYRVYGVTTPQVWLTIVADSEAGLAAQLAATEPHLSANIVRAQEKGMDVTAAQLAFTDLEAQVTAAQQQVSGISANVLSFTPASYPGCWTAFENASQRLQDGAAALRQAGSDVRAILKATADAHATAGARPSPSGTSPASGATT